MKTNKLIAIFGLVAGMTFSAVSHAQDASGTTTATATTTTTPPNGGRGQFKGRHHGHFEALNFGICSIQNNCPVNPIAQCVVTQATQQKVTIPPMPAFPGMKASPSDKQAFFTAMKARREVIKPLAKTCRAQAKAAAAGSSSKS